MPSHGLGEPGIVISDRPAPPTLEGRGLDSMVRAQFPWRALRLNHERSHLDWRALPQNA